MPQDMKIDKAFMMQDPCVLASAGFAFIDLHVTPGTLHDHDGQPACIHGADGSLKGGLYLLPKTGRMALGPFKPNKARLTIIPSPHGPAWAWHLSQSDAPSLSHGDWIGHIGPTML